MEPDKSINNEALKYFKIDIKEAENGAKKFGEVFSQLDRETQRSLRSSENTFGELALFSIGIKPCVMKDDPDSDKYATKFVENNAGSLIIGDYLVWSDKTAQVIKDNPDVFNDYKDTNNLKGYLEKILTDEDLPNKDYKLGLLLGYPKEASELFSKYMDDYASFFRTVYSDIISSHSNVDPETKQFFKDFVHNGEKNDIERSNKFRDLHQSETFNIIRSLDTFKNYSDEQIKYICNTRGVQSKGLSYMGVFGTDSYDKVPKYVNEVFSVSGLDTQINKIDEDLMRIDYKTDYPLVVKDASSAIANILANHMMWGLMQDNPELKIKGDFKEMRELFSNSVAVSREHSPGKDVDQFEHDFLQGFDKITQSILNTVKNRNGIYMSGQLSNLPSIEGLNWIAKESLEILNEASFEVSPIIEKIKSSPNMEEVKAEDVFVEVFPKPLI